jgi:hypothetical protein
MACRYVAKNINKDSFFCPLWSFPQISAIPPRGGKKRELTEIAVFRRFQRILGVFTQNGGMAEICGIAETIVTGIEGTGGQARPSELFF